MQVATKAPQFRAVFSQRDALKSFERADGLLDSGAVLAEFSERKWVISEFIRCRMAGQMRRRRAASLLRFKTQTHRHHRATRDKRLRNYHFPPTDRVSRPVLTVTATTVRRVANASEATD